MMPGRARVTAVGGQSNGSEKETLRRKKLAGLESNQDVGAERYGGFKYNTQVCGTDHRAKIFVKPRG